MAADSFTYFKIRYLATLCAVLTCAWSAMWMPNSPGS